ncbi:GNAT family N-acetyltransferase [Winslowiella toletana]|nr:GNAT family N-acetyltransferase [Winslowiella toletana]
MMNYTTVVIETPRLILRPITRGDAASWFAIMRDPQVMKYWGHRPWQQISQAEEGIAADMEAMASGEYLKLALTAKPDNQCIGMCIFFHHHQGSQRGAIGYCLASEAQGRGYMTEALQYFFAFLRQQMSLRRLEADVNPHNLASIRMLQRMGFQQEGVMRERWCVEGVTSDSLLFGLLLNK